MNGSKNGQRNTIMHLDDLFIENKDASALKLADSNVVSYNDALIDSVAGLSDFWRITKENTIRKNAINISIIHKNLTFEKVREIKEKILYVLDSLAISNSPVYFMLINEENNKIQTCKLGSNEPSEIVFKQYERFKFYASFEFNKNNIYSIIRCVVQLNAIVENVRKITYNSTECNIGKYFEVGDQYMFPKSPTAYDFDWCGLQNEIFNNDEIINLISKTNRLYLLLHIIEMIGDDKKNCLKIFNCLTRYNKRKLIKLIKAI